MLEQYTHLFLRKGRLKVNIVGDFRQQYRVDYFNSNLGAFHHFYIKYNGTFYKDLHWGMKANMLLVMKYDNGRKTKLYKKEIKLDQDEADNFIDNINAIHEGIS